MPVQLVNPDPRYANVHLIDPAPLGYLHLAANTEARAPPGTRAASQSDQHQVLGLLKWQARQLAELHAVERVTLYDAVAFAPPGVTARTGPRR